MPLVYSNDIVDIELERGSLHRSFLNHAIGRKDENANRFGVRVFRNREPVILTGYSCVGFFHDAHGRNIIINQSSHTQIFGNEAWVVLPQNVYDYEGPFTLTIKLTKVESSWTESATMRIIDGMVDNTYTDGAVGPTAAVPTADQILTVYDAMVAETEKSPWYLRGDLMDEIDENSDLNDGFTSPGQYRVKTLERAQTIDHLPIVRPGLLTVGYISAYETSTKTYFQAYMVTGSGFGVYLRYGHEVDGEEPGTRVTSWNDWKHVMIEPGFALTDTDSKSIQIPQDPGYVDLNEFLTPGQYKISSQSVALALLHRPAGFRTTGMMLIFNTHNDNHVVQLIVSNGNAAWMRHIMISSGTVGEWLSIGQDTRSWMNGATFKIHDPNEERIIDCEVLNEYVEPDGFSFDNTTKIYAKRSGSETYYFTSKEIYKMWDKLQSEYPDFIDEGEVIGYSTDMDGSEYYYSTAHDAPVKAYYIHGIHEYTTSGGNTQTVDYGTLPTVYLVTGTHGKEKTNGFLLFEFFRRAFINGSIYSDLLRGREYRVIPCLDRWSYDHRERYLAPAYMADPDNPGGVIPDPSKYVDGEISVAYDANRQCIYADMAHPSYATRSLYSYATECAGLMKYLNDTGYPHGGVDCFIDIHHNDYSLGYSACANQAIRQLYNRTMDDLNRIWMELATWNDGRKVNYFTTCNDPDEFKGKICARNPPVETSYAWAFGAAYAPAFSALVELQQNDGGNATQDAIAKALDQYHHVLHAYLGTLEIG